jgi:hypothetical protein
MVADPATSEPWDAMQATEATLRGLLHMVGVAARNGNRLGAEHHNIDAHLRRALGANAYARLELPVMTLYAGNPDKPQVWWKWLLGHYYAAERKPRPASAEAPRRPQVRDGPCCAEASSCT